MAVDGAFVDSRFEPGGQFSDFRFTAAAAATEVERRVRDRCMGESWRLPSSAAHEHVPDGRELLSG